MDKKFIALAISFVDSLSDDLIILVDQHAADERVQLEKVLSQSYEIKQGPKGNMMKALKSACATPPIEVMFRPDRVRLMKSFREAFLQQGFEFTLVITCLLKFFFLILYALI